MAQLLKRFENIVALAPVSDVDVILKPILLPETDIRSVQTAGRDRNATAVEAYQIEVETAALVRVPSPWAKRAPRNPDAM